MGKHSNIIAIADKSENKIIEAIKHIDYSQNSYRTILPGSTYIYPPKTQAKNPFSIGDEKLFEILSTQDLTPKNLRVSFSGSGRDTATELAAQLRSDRLKQFRLFSKRKKTQPSLTEESYAAATLRTVRGPLPACLSFLDYYYQDKAERDRVAQQANELIKRVASELDKNRKKLVKRQEELQATDHAEDFRQKGELLTTYLHQVPNDQPVVTLDNYYTGQPIEIDLDVALTPSQNAQRYFQEVPKTQRGRQALDQSD